MTKQRPIFRDVGASTDAVPVQVPRDRGWLRNAWGTRGVDARETQPQLWLPGTVFSCSASQQAIRAHKLTVTQKQRHVHSLETETTLKVVVRPP